MSTFESIAKEVQAERVRQDIKWGRQEWPSVPLDEPRDHRIFKEAMAKQHCQATEKDGTLAWIDIAQEELQESGAAKDDVECRGELVQLAAVVFAWIDNIDRRAERGVNNCYSETLSRPTVTPKPPPTSPF